MGWLAPGLCQSLPVELAQRLTQPAGLFLDELEVVSAALRESRWGQGWRNERFEVSDQNGGPVLDSGGQVVGLERALFRPLGLFYRTAQLNLRAADGRIWVAQRAAHKAIDPGLWDAAVAGGIGLGETAWQALVREAWEEAGLDERQMQRAEFRGEVLVERLLGSDGGGGLQRELVVSYDLWLADQTQPQNRDGEVQQFECVNLEQIWQRWVQGLFNHEAAVGCLDFLAPQPD